MSKIPQGFHMTGARIAAMMITPAPLNPVDEMKTKMRNHAAFSAALAPRGGLSAM